MQYAPIVDPRADFANSTMNLDLSRLLGGHLVRHSIIETHKSVAVCLNPCRERAPLAGLKSRCKVHKCFSILWLHSTERALELLSQAIRDDISCCVMMPCIFGETGTGFPPAAFGGGAM